MATRNLTDVFVLMRNNALRNRRFFAEQETTEKMSLVNLNDVERGFELGSYDNIPPMWIDHLEDAQASVVKLQKKIDELKLLHSRHLQRPTLDDNRDEEKQIDRITKDISNMFNAVHRDIVHIKSQGNRGKKGEQRLAENVVRALASAMQDLSHRFRDSQNSYLKQLNSREERSRGFFEPDFLDYESMDQMDTDFLASSQLLVLEEENTQMAHQREEEINKIIHSIVDLNDIFKELSHMIADQGTILDRIDYNIELTQSQVQEGLKQLQKAHKHQRSSQKMCCILTLGATTSLLIFILILVKF